MICFNYGYELLEMKIMPDHCHLFISAPPTIVQLDIVKTLKSVSAETIQGYIQNQKLV